MYKLYNCTYLFFILLFSILIIILMSQSSIPTHYKLRVTWSKTTTTQSAFLNVLEKITDACASVDENLDSNYHTHFYIISTSTESLIRRKIRESLGASNAGDRGNAVYSLSQMELQDGSLFAVEYLAYMSKSGMVFLSRSFNPEWLSQAVELDKVIKEEIRAKRKEKAKNKFQTILDSCREAVMAKPADEMSVPTCMFNTVYPVIADYYVSTGGRSSVAMIESTVHSVMFTLSPDYREVVRQKVDKRLLSV